MDATTPKSRFAEFNLDPALAEAVESASPQQIIEGIVRLDDPRQIPPKFIVVSQFIRICTGRFLASDAWTIRLHPNVLSLKAARPMGIYECCKHLPEAEDSEEIVQRATRPLPFTGRGCIVAALDFGLDFVHPNFLNSDGTTRVIAFWNQVAAYDPAHPNRYGYGRVFSPAEINRALRASNPYQALGYHPAISDTGHGSHGTHTLDIAAGNGRAPGSAPGVASDADLIFVHLSTPSPGPIGDLGDSVRMLEALDFVHLTAQDRPWVVNLSVGRTGGSHDGTSPFEQAMHEILRFGSGRAIVQSAGNYRAADLAVEGWLRDGESRDLEWIIDPRDTAPNEIDAWYSGNDRLLVALQPPEGGRFVEVRLGQVADISHDGTLVGRIYHRRNDPNNRDNHIEVFLYPNAPSGVWTLRLFGEYVINGRFHAWIERSLARPGAQSRFDPQITTHSYTLGTIATSPLVITVGAYDAHLDGEPLAPFSSCGPTRDDRHEKPELLAPGVSVLAARSIPRSAARQEGLLVARSGTSMATPHVAGCVAAMFEAAGRPVSIQEIRHCLKHSADPVAHAENTDCCAWGRLNIAEAVDKIRDLAWPDSLSAHMGGVDFSPSQTANWPASSDAIAEEFTLVSGEQFVPVPPDTIQASDFDPDRVLERADQALRETSAPGRQSEIDFLQRLLCELDGSTFAQDLSPAALFRAVAKGSLTTLGAKDFFDVVALPSARPEVPLRPGDWMLRAAPGTGDVGHVSVLASADLWPHSALASNGIAAEGEQPGYYGLVIEAGLFPRSLSCPFARRLTDSSGRLPPHTLILRPKYSCAGLIADVPVVERYAPPQPAEDAPPPAQPAPSPPMQTQAPPAPGPLELDPPADDADNDIVLVIITIVKPADVGQYWADKVRPNYTRWAHPLSEFENGYIEAMTDPSVPAVLRMRTPVDPRKMTQEDSDSASHLFGTGSGAAARYANYENRRRILAHYVYTHPATVRLQLGLYRMVRDINPLHFALERGWQIGGGKEMFTGQDVSRLGAAFEFVSSVALVYGVGRVLEATRPAAGATPRAPRSLQDPIYDLPPDGGGMYINGRWYTEHALERMAPDIPQVRAQLRANILARLERIGITTGNPVFDRIYVRALQRIDPRGVPPSVVESEIQRPGSTNVRVVTARRGGVVVTVIPRSLRPAPPVSGEAVPDEADTPQQPDAEGSPDRLIVPLEAIPAENSLPDYHGTSGEVLASSVSLPPKPPAGEANDGEDNPTQKSGATADACPWWLPQDTTASYLTYAQQQTWGRATLLINGRFSRGDGTNDDRSEPFDRMQLAVESTNPGDAVYLASWMFDPATKLTKKSASGTTWGDLIADRANKGVTFRLLLNDFPKLMKWSSNLKGLDALILRLPDNKRDNVKYVLSQHPAYILISDFYAKLLSTQSGLSVPAGPLHVAVHHQKFMVVRYKDHLTAFCGGVDIIPGMTPVSWSTTPWRGWHDLQVHLEGPITRDIEKEFVWRWNRERGASQRQPLPGWQAHEKLGLTPLSTAEQIPGVYRTAIQMLRTVSESTGDAPAAFSTTRRSDVRQAYQHGIACAYDFLYLENQYFRVPELADWIVARGAERPSLIVIIVVVHSTMAESDDGKSALTDHGFFLQHQTFERLVTGLGAPRVRFYEMHKRYVHAKLILADDRWCSIGSANVNPRSFELDSELNVQMREPDPEVLNGFRKRLWAHNLGVSEAEVGKWAVSDFITQWDKVAAANARKGTDRMVGEGILTFDYKKFPGKSLPINPGPLATLGIPGGGSRSDQIA